MDKNHKIEMYKILGENLDKGTFKDKEVFVFGHCNASEHMIDFLADSKVQVKAILDNNIMKQGQYYKNISIVSPENPEIYNSEEAIVLIATRFFNDMALQLEKLGFKGQILQIGKFKSYDIFSEYKVSADVINKHCEQLKQGLTLLDNLTINRGHLGLIVCPNQALGDVYWACAFLPPYCKEHNLDIQEIKLAVIGMSCAEVAKIFGFENIKILNDFEMETLVQAIVYTEREDCLIAHQDLPYTDNIIKWINKHFLSFIDYYRYAVYGLDSDVIPEIPSKLEEYEYLSLIPKGRAVIVSPYAKSVVNPPLAFWENIVEDYREKGLEVYTSVVGNEEAIKGTRPIEIPIRQLQSTVEHAGEFIGLRSGICDVIDNAKCKKTVVFPDCYYSTTPHKVEDFFALDTWHKIVV